MAETLKFDATCTTPEQRTGFAYRAQEVLRLEHNIVGKWKREGITQAEYDQLSQSIKLLFRYSEKLLPEKYWERYQVEIFEPKSQIICKGITDNRQALMDSTVYTINLDNIMEIK